MVRDKPGGRLIALVEDKKVGSEGDFRGDMIEGLIDPS
jgi:hypothetical protein